MCNVNRHYFLALGCMLIVSQSIYPSVSSNAKNDLICETHVSMGTLFKSCVYSNGRTSLQAVSDLRSAFSVIDDIDGWMSDWKPHTELSQINAAAGVRGVVVRDELFDILQTALQISRKTGGAFDPTFNAFWGLYNFKPGHQRAPTEAEIAERLPLVDYKSVRIDKEKRQVFLVKKGMKLGLGGIGQGYAVERMSQKLRRLYTAGYVDGSGDTYFWGRKPNGELWTTGIRDPRNKEKIILRIHATDVAITTCGDDEKFFFQGNRRIHHIIDPKNGKPAQLSRQTTIIAATPTMADAYDTATFVLGPARSKPLVESLGMEGVFVDDNGVTLTAGLVPIDTPWGRVYQLRRN